MENKKPRFFCENCNAEVKRDAKFCKKCGHFFASVKCPACGKIGTAEIFKKGCPLCGYAVPSSDDEETEKNTDTKAKLSLKSKKKIKKAFNISRAVKKEKNRDEGLPLWIYFITFTVLIIVLVILLLNTI
ncbi:MAG: zinc ribbon domain-containing protein [Spirochaetaceae bacterium]|nr:zinc ribbon domain-containing protein [Spirochaetaceae bacterium]